MLGLMRSCQRSLPSNLCTSKRHLRWISADTIVLRTGTSGLKIIEPRTTQFGLALVRKTSHLDRGRLRREFAKRTCTLEVLALKPGPRSTSLSAVVVVPGSCRATRAFRGVKKGRVKFLYSFKDRSSEFEIVLADLDDTSPGII